MEPFTGIRNKAPTKISTLTISLENVAGCIKLNNNEATTKRDEEGYNPEQNNISYGGH